MNGKMMVQSKIKKAFFIGLGIHTGQGRHLVFIGPGLEKSFLERVFNERFCCSPFAAYAHIQIFRYESDKRFVRMDFFIGNDDAAFKLFLWKV